MLAPRSDGALRLVRMRNCFFTAGLTGMDESRLKSVRRKAALSGAAQDRNLSCSSRTSPASTVESAVQSQRIGAALGGALIGAQQRVGVGKRCRIDDVRFVQPAGLRPQPSPRRAGRAEGDKQPVRATVSPIGLAPGLARRRAQARSRAYAVVGATRRGRLAEAARKRWSLRTALSRRSCPARGFKVAVGK